MLTAMSAQKKWLGAGVLAVLVVVAAAVALRSRVDERAASQPAAAAGAEPRSAVPGREPGARAEPEGQPAAAPVEAKLNPNIPTMSPNDRVMAYRPAKFLYYSEDSPAKSAADDDAQPVLKRIFELTQADGPQQVQVRGFWKTHEDKRRALWAAAYPRASGPRILDAEKLEEVDSEFESSVFTILKPAQRQALTQELPPAGASRTPPPQMYADPRLEK